MEPNDSRRVWLTGAGKGIGRALAIAMVEAGWTVAASARTADDLDSLAAEAETKPGHVVGYPVDVTRAAEVSETVERIEADLGPLDLVVLNAGTHQPFKAADFDIETFRRLVETNLMGTVNCLAPVMARFIERGRGHIAVVASVAGYAGLPTAAGYSATKAALINMCEALEPDLARHGVKLQLVSPGFVDTPLTRKNEFKMPFLIPADQAANDIMAGLQSRRFEIVFPFGMKVAMKALRALPYRLFFAITRRMVGS
ncbi:SDR family NAD(P)-dependent oxidoreductase [Bauldia sp.]|uniref:SDR family NAD(P)-dependent oxidoreductase n=1 Tax=Bauldia sp. TaxID=2575872 RepID=UPI003BAAF6BF